MMTDYQTAQLLAFLLMLAPTAGLIAVTVPVSRYMEREVSE